MLQLLWSAVITMQSFALVFLLTEKMWIVGEILHILGNTLGLFAAIWELVTRPSLDVFWILMVVVFLVLLVVSVKTAFFRRIINNRHVKA